MVAQRARNHVAELARLQRESDLLHLGRDQDAAWEEDQVAAGVLRAQVLRVGFGQGYEVGAGLQLVQQALRLRLRVDQDVAGVDVLGDCRDVLGDQLHHLHPDEARARLLPGALVGVAHLGQPRLEGILAPVLGDKIGHIGIDLLVCDDDTRLSRRQLGQRLLDHHVEDPGAGIGQVVLPILALRIDPLSLQVRLVLGHSLIVFGQVDGLPVHERGEGRFGRGRGGLFRDGGWLPAGGGCSRRGGRGGGAGPQGLGGDGGRGA